MSLTSVLTQAELEYLATRVTARIATASRAGVPDVATVAFALEGESLIVGPTDLSRTNYNDAFFYYLFPELPPGTRYIEMDPGLADASDSGLAEELLNNDWLILSDVWSDWSEPNTSSGSGSPVPNQVVKDHYCKVTEANMFSLYRCCR